LLEVDDGLRELIARRASTDELRTAAVDAGMTTMLQDGLEKAKAGVTTIEEVLRVLALDHSETQRSSADSLALHGRQRPRLALVHRGRGGADSRHSPLSRRRDRTVP